MEGLKTCSNGHFYEEKLTECPHCPKKNTSNEEGNDKTTVLNDNSPTVAETTSTKVFSGEASKGTQVVSNSSPGSSRSNSSQDFTKTRVTGADVDNETSGNNSTDRKVLKGWIITYDIDKYGVDFKIYEGRNTIGKSSEQSITVMDSEVSSLHAVLLYRSGKFYITDELSTNGVKVNDQELLPRDPHELNDGDKIALGSKITFLFRKSY